LQNGTLQEGELDDPFLLKMSAAFLERQGYTVITQAAEGAKVAVQITRDQ
jgi:hypothetical protein